MTELTHDPARCPKCLATGPMLGHIYRVSDQDEK